MTLGLWGLLWLLVYIAGLVYLVWFATRHAPRGKLLTTSVQDFYTASDRPLGVAVLVFTFAATLFSSFFMVGLPGFIYTHGLATWPWVILGDVAGMLGLFLVGRRFLQERRKCPETLSPLEVICPNFLSRMFFIGLTTIFILPYLAVQISGFGKLLNSATDGAVSFLVASALGLTVIYLYSLIAGIRGIALSDFFQGALLLGCVGALGAKLAFQDNGGPVELLASVQVSAPQLLDTPGPRGLFTSGYLVSGFVLFAAIPITQPQFLTRYLLVTPEGGERYLRIVAISMGTLIAVGALLIIPVGLHGALVYPDLKSGDDLLGS